jgi:HD-GYP domain-containing protein (c-di-GMP phosphodiesterase class II)
MCPAAVGSQGRFDALVSFSFNVGLGTLQRSTLRSKFNRGELHNLSIARGTLTAEERYIINHHIVQTILMLDRLPFPKHLQNVTEIAGGHHEKMDGTGYPKRLTREQMSLPARMMAIADIFEALTAVDRPYKKGKTLSEALNIMVGMCKGAHIDPQRHDEGHGR